MLPSSLRIGKYTFPRVKPIWSLLASSSLNLPLLSELYYSSKRERMLWMWEMFLTPEPEISESN